MMWRRTFLVLAIICLGIVYSGCHCFGTRAEGHPLIVPRPKVMADGTWDIVVSTTERALSSIVLDSQSPILRVAAAEINKYVIKNGGKELPILDRSEWQDNGVAIHLALGFDDASKRTGFAIEPIRIPAEKRKGQAYIIRSKGDDILLLGDGDKGLLYAAVTFCHLLKSSPDGVCAYRTSVDDWPDFQWRGDCEVGTAIETRAYLFDAKKHKTNKTYEEEVKDYIDFCLHLKLNLMTVYKANLVYNGKNYREEFVAYAKARGFSVSSALYASFFTKDGSKQPDMSLFNNYLTQTAATKADFMEHIGRYFAWSNEELLRTMVREKVLPGEDVYFHFPDTGDENWGKRGEQCRKKFGSDRAMADAFVLNTLFDELKNINKTDNGVRIFAVVYPYSPYFVDPVYFKYYEENVDHFKRLHAQTPIKISFCARECTRSSLEKWLALMPGRPFYLYHEQRNHGIQLLATNIRCAKTYYFPDRHEDIISYKIGVQHWELDTPLAAEYAWNTESPGSAYIDAANSWEFSLDNKIDKAFIEETLPRTVRFTWGEDAAPLMLAAYSSGLNIDLAINPIAAQKSLNRIYDWNKTKPVLPLLSPDIFQKQEKAAELVCQNSLKIMAGEIPVPNEFLRLRASRLYKHSMAAKLFASVYFHYFSALQAVDTKNIDEAKRQITLAKEKNSMVQQELRKQEDFVRNFPQESSSFISSDLQSHKPLELLSKKIAEFKIPSLEELEKTSCSESLLSHLLTRSIMAERVASAPTIDGHLNDLCWTQHKHTASDFVKYPFTGTPKLAFEQSEIKVAYDDKNLYVAFRANDQDFDKLRSASKLQHDSSDIFKGDALEIFLNPNTKNLNRVQFVVDVANKTFDSFIQEKNSKKVSYVQEWNPSWQHATSLDDKGWSAEFAIPFDCLIAAPVSELSLQPKPGDSWRVYFAREKRELEYSGIKFIKDANFHSVKEYPELRFLPLP